VETFVTDLSWNRHLLEMGQLHEDKKEGGGGYVLKVLQGYIDKLESPAQAMDAPRGKLGMTATYLVISKAAAFADNCLTLTGRVSEPHPANQASPIGNSSTPSQPRPPRPRL